MKYYYYYDMDAREVFPECPSYVMTANSDETKTTNNYSALFLIGMVALVLTFV